MNQFSSGVIRCLGFSILSQINLLFICNNQYKSNVQKIVKLAIKSNAKLSNESEYKI